MRLGLLIKNTLRYTKSNTLRHLVYSASILYKLMQHTSDVSFQVTLCCLEVIFLVYLATHFRLTIANTCFVNGQTHCMSLLVVIDSI